jgi:peptide/nickel transport system ATP-binding protein
VPLVSIRQLTLEATTARGTAHILRGIDLDIGKSRILGVVGESGSGKSSLAACLVRLLPANLSRLSGEIVFDGVDLLALDERAMNAYRGTRIAMIFQDPMTALTPVYTIGWQIAEQVLTHNDVSKQAARARAVELLTAVGIPNPEVSVDRYPHQLSGGMRQRAVIAMALSCNPSLLIADEPTTALDVTVQAQILELIQKLRRDFGSAVVLITHDMGVVAEVADRVAVMYAGRIVERGAKRDIFKGPRHPYTWGLLDSIPPLDGPRPHRLKSIAGMPPSLLALPKGCAFGPRCRFRFVKCSEQPPLEGEGGHEAACHLSMEERARQHAARSLRQAS